MALCLEPPKHLVSTPNPPPHSGLPQGFPPSLNLDFQFSAHSQNWHIPLGWGSLVGSLLVILAPLFFIASIILHFLKQMMSIFYLAFLAFLGRSAVLP